MALDGGIDARGDIFNRLLKSRVIMLGSDVDDAVANQICAQLLFLEGEDPKSDIWLYINSPGGSVTAGMAIYDTMQFVSCDVATVCVGLAASMGQFLLTVAFTSGPPARVAVVGLSQVAFGMVCDVLLWDHSFGPWTLLGMLLVIGPTAWVMLRKS